jgi:hypothetical protein
MNITSLILISAGERLLAAALFLAGWRRTPGTPIDSRNWSLAADGPQSVTFDYALFLAKGGARRAVFKKPSGKRVPGGPGQLDFTKDDIA